MTEHYAYHPEDEPLPEGEEAPPPHVHTMAIIRWVILGGLSLFALIMVLSALDLTPWATDQGSVVQHHCPICGMTLVPIKSGSEKTAPSDSMRMEQEPPAHIMAKPGQYTCPMHPEVISDQPGKCPKCGMNLEQVPQATPATPEEHDMSKMGGMPGMPGMESAINTSTTPGGGEKGAMGDMGSAPVPGLVPVTIEPERLQLIGVRTAKVERRALGTDLKQGTP